MQDHSSFQRNHPMAAAIILGFFLIAALVVWATKLALWEGNPKRVRVLHHCSFAAAAVAARVGAVQFRSGRNQRIPVCRLHDVGSGADQPHRRRPDRTGLGVRGARFGRAPHRPGSAGPRPERRAPTPAGPPAQHHRSKSRRSTADSQTAPPQPVVQRQQHQVEGHIHPVRRPKQRDRGWIAGGRRGRD